MIIFRIVRKCPFFISKTLSPNHLTWAKIATVASRLCSIWRPEIATHDLPFSGVGRGLCLSEKACRGYTIRWNYGEDQKKVFAKNSVFFPSNLSVDFFPLFQKFVVAPGGPISKVVRPFTADHWDASF